MTSRPVTGIRTELGKDGKPRLVRTRPYKAKNKALRDDRLVKAWQKKTPPKRG